MKDTTKIALVAGGAVVAVVGGYFGKKFISTKGFGKAVETVAEASKDASGDISDAAKEVVDEVTDSID